MTPYEQNLYNQMKKLVSSANMRILRLERETGLTNSFGVKQLTDYLSSEKINIVTKRGRIGTKIVGTRKDLSIEQMKAVNTKLRSFMSPDSISTVKQARQYKKHIQEKGINFKNVGYKEVNAEYQAYKDSRAIVEHVDSDYWTISRLAKTEEWDEDKFINRVSSYLDKGFIDESTKDDLKRLYDYSMGVKL